ncbi:MAG: aldolase/citrate lyase family protein, partial [Candidatus Omnitrophica bacterium]|nr:aldolase/citrate lyase family protein [Candidatus Omnitrophota bacterium]
MKDLREYREKIDAIAKMAEENKDANDIAEKIKELETQIEGMQADEQTRDDLIKEREQLLEALNELVVKNKERVTEKVPKTVREKAKNLASVFPWFFIISLASLIFGARAGFTATSRFVTPDWMTVLNSFTTGNVTLFIITIFCVFIIMANINIFGFGAGSDDNVKQNILHSIGEKQGSVINKESFAEEMIGGLPGNTFIDSKKDIPADDPLRYAKFIAETSYGLAQRALDDPTKLAFEIFDGRTISNTKNTHIVIGAYISGVRVGVTHSITGAIAGADVIVNNHSTFTVPIPQPVSDKMKELYGIQKGADLSVKIVVLDVGKTAPKLKQKLIDDMSNRLSSIKITPPKAYKGFSTMKHVFVKGYAAYYNANEDTDVALAMVNIIPKEARISGDAALANNAIEDAVKQFEEAITEVKESIVVDKKNRSPIEKETLEIIERIAGEVVKETRKPFEAGKKKSRVSPAVLFHREIGAAVGEKTAELKETSLRSTRKTSHFTGVIGLLKIVDAAVTEKILKEKISAADVQNEVNKLAAVLARVQRDEVKRIEEKGGEEARTLVPVVKQHLEEIYQKTVKRIERGAIPAIIALVDEADNVDVAIGKLERALENPDYSHLTPILQDMQKTLELAQEKKKLLERCAYYLQALRDGRLVFSKGNELVEANAADDISAASKELILDKVSAIKEGEKQVLFLEGVLLSSELETLISKLNLAAIVTTEAGPTTHWVIFAKDYGIPVFLLRRGKEASGTGLSMNEIMKKVEIGDLVLLNSPGKILEAAPEAETIRTFGEKALQYYAFMKYFRFQAKKPAHINEHVAGTAPGEVMKVQVNVEREIPLKKAINLGALDGVGLVRTEFWVQARHDFIVDFLKAPMLSEESMIGEAKLRKYLYDNEKTLLDAAKEQALTYRVIEAAGDKPIAGMTPRRLGMDYYRLEEGLHLLLVQLETLFELAIRENAYDRIRILFPQVQTKKDMGEMLEVARVAKNNVLEKMKNVEGIEDIKQKLEHIEIGAMIESVTAMENTKEIARLADFVSIGSNDLVASLFQEEGRSIREDINK